MVLYTNFSSRVGAISNVKWDCRRWWSSGKAYSNMKVTGMCLLGERKQVGIRCRVCRKKQVVRCRIKKRTSRVDLFILNLSKGSRLSLYISLVRISSCANIRFLPLQKRCKRKTGTKWPWQSVALREVLLFF